MKDNIGRGVVGLIGCLGIVILALALAIVGILIHWPTWFCVTAAAVVVAAKGAFSVWMES